MEALRGAGAWIVSIPAAPDQPSLSIDTTCPLVRETEVDGRSGPRTHGIRAPEMDLKRPPKVGQYDTRAAYDRADRGSAEKAYKLDHSLIV